MRSAAVMVPADPIAALSAWLLRCVPAPAAGARPVVVGMVGLPGCGKSTLAAALLGAMAAASGPSALAVSLDDFYLEPGPRRQRGYGFRGPPGTHDLELLERFLLDLDAREAPLKVPAFDREHERRLPPRLVPVPPALCLFEGWFVGAPAPGYERLARRLDRLLYLDLGIEQARAARLRREAVLRDAGAGGMSDEAVARFWDQALAPHFAALVLPLRETADVVVTLGSEHQITALHFGRGEPAVPGR